MKRILVPATMLIISALLLSISPNADLRISYAQTPPKPFGLPFKTDPGPNTWLMSQPYGNTVGAFSYGRYWYAAGQNIHFGVDFAANCGTPVVAIGDGEIDQVDNFSFGLEPHNLTIFHRALGLTSIYGHFNVKSDLQKGQAIKRGDVIGVTGDPDLTCESRPHLHLEIRNSSYTIAYNPVTYIDADWNMLSSIGYHMYGGFIKDLTLPNRWQAMLTQPDVDFNEAPLNEYSVTWPLPARREPTPYTHPAFTAAPLTTTPQTVPLQQLTLPGCCSMPWWSPDSQEVLYWNDAQGNPVQIWAVGLHGEAPHVSDSDYLQQRSADDQFAIVQTGGQLFIRRRADHFDTPIATGGAWPTFSPNTTRLLWHRFPADWIPGSVPPSTEIWIANIDGSNRSLVKVQPGGWVYWLDDDRLLLVEPIGRANRYKLILYTISINKFELMMPQIDHLRGLAVAPGGQHILLYAPFNADPNVSGIYLLETKANADAVKLPIFGSYRWRDSQTLYYLPFTPNQPMQLHLYDITTNADTVLTDPTQQAINIANDDWTVAPNGNRIVYWDGRDYAIRVLNFEQSAP